MKNSDKIVIKELGENRTLGYKELNRLFGTIRERSQNFIKAEQIEMYASVKEMEKGVLDIDIKISDDIIDRKDYIRQIVSDGIRWFMMRYLLCIMDRPDGEPPFMHTVKPLLMDIELGYYIVLHDEYTKRQVTRWEEV